MRFLPVLVIATVVACGGGTSTPTRSSGPASARPTTVTAASPIAVGGAEELCFLTAADWQQFNYVTGAEPDVTSDESADAICQYANGLFLEVYTHETEAEAEETIQAIVENVPMDDVQELTLPGADEVLFDAETGDDNASIAVRAGNLAFTISGLARETAQAELMTLAGLVLTRSTALQ